MNMTKSDVLVGLLLLFMGYPKFTSLMSLFVLLLFLSYI